MMMELVLKNSRMPIMLRIKYISSIKEMVCGGCMIHMRSRETYEVTAGYVEIRDQIKRISIIGG
jgi:hypothetical protein